ncbi:glycosyltransferase [Sneathiella sp. P13V-1]|uniref:glycosyltransferase family protein n=1 Tax=Sneathiella sp. P13V-1 TaxID=2697366 RepID=UPI00187B5BB3|nr:glycosyltransferase [Sneathiella sp. P13V-1]MBE7638542.1 glycosyltransferase [Sneathiella sp. P13V-1]
MLSDFIRKKIVDLIPRTARNIAVIGSNAADVSAEFRPYNPDCKVKLFPSIKRFVMAVQERPEVTYQTAVVLDAYANDADFHTQLTELKEHLVEGGMILTCVINPFYYQFVEQKIGKETKLSAQLLTGLMEKQKTFQAQVNLLLKDTGLFFDHLFQFPNPTAQSWVTGKMEEVDNNGQKLLRTMMMSFCAERLIMRLMDHQVPQLRIQAQVLKPVGGVNDVRIHEPLTALSSLPGVLSHASRAEKLVVNSPTNMNKIFIWHRPILTLDEGLKHIQSLRKAGYLIITEFDDHYSPWPAIEANKYLNFVGVHAVQTTKEELADLFREFNPHIGVFPNQLNKMPARDLRQASEVPNIFFGALNRQDDWKPIMPQINEILKGVSGDFHFDVVFDKEFFDALETDKKSFAPECEYSEYLEILQKADIALLPLQDTEFNRMKSDLKLVEVAGSGAVAIASPVVYEQTDPEAKFVEFATNPAQFAEKLKMLIEDPEYRFERQLRGRRYVRGNRLLHHSMGARYNWIRELLENKEILDQELGKRLSALS